MRNRHPKLDSCRRLLYRWSLALSIGRGIRRQIAIFSVHVPSPINSTPARASQEIGQNLVQNLPPLRAEVIKNWRIDQILTSDMFGLSSARGESTEKLLNRRRKLLMRPKLSRGAKRQLNTLEEKLGTVPVAETPEYIHAMQIVDKASKHI